MRRLWLFCLALALLLRFAVVALAVRGGYNPYEDARLHGDAGRNLAYGISLSRGEGFSVHYQPVLAKFFANPESVHPPGPARASFKKFMGYPLFLAAAFRAFGYHLGFIIFLQAVMSALTVALVYAIAAELSTPRAGLMAMALAGCYYPFALDAVTLMPETINSFVFALGTLGVVRYAKNVNARNAAWAGVATAAAVITKSVSLPLILIALVCSIRRHLPWKATAAPAAVFLCVVLLMLAPIAVRNVRAFGRFSIQPAYSGSALIQLQNPYTTPASYTPPGWIDAGSAGLRRAFREAEAAVPADRRDDDFAIDDAYMAYAVRFIGAHPMQALRNSWLSLVNTWMFDYPTAHFVRKLTNAVCYVAMIPFFLAGSWMVIRRHDRAGLAVLASVAAFIAVQAVFVSEMRYRTGIMPEYFAVAALGLEQAYVRLSANKHYRS